MLVTMVPGVAEEVFWQLGVMGTAGRGYYFVNGPHAAERQGPPGDDHSVLF